ncbi:2,3-dehydroadipyl-CoA hydratase [compost metagenome]
MALLHTKLDAHQAHAFGLVVQVVPPAGLPAAGLELAKRLASGAAGAQAGVKRLLRDGLQTDLAGTLEAEKAQFVALSATDDFAEGVNAFCQRRSANFTATH